MNNDVIGASPNRSGGHARVTGHQEYLADLKMTDVLHVKLVKLACARARIIGIDTTEATLGATVDSDGGDTILERGTLWSTSTPADENALAAPVVSPFTHLRSGMPAGTLIYYRGYADNSAGRGYSPESSFYTEPLPATGVSFASVNETTMRVE